MTFTYTPLPAFSDNYIWIVSAGCLAVVVDPGDAAPVLTFCRSKNLVVAAILLTHHHADHVGGVAELLNSDVVAGNIEVFGPMSESIAHVTQPVAGGHTVVVDSLGFTAAVMNVPGHTNDHIAYLQPRSSHDVAHLFCGDTLFASGCGRLFEGTPKQMLQSLDTLAALDDATKVHCAHEYTLKNIEFASACEPQNIANQEWDVTARWLRQKGQPTLPTTIGHEKAVNPFMRCDEPTIRAALFEWSGTKAPDRVTAFAQLRAWKDEFASFLSSTTNSKSD